MELRQLRYAEAIARYMNFSKAADSLYITQQTLSQQIKKLEEEIGFEIFIRTTRSVILTEKGKQFVGKAVPTLRAFDSFAAEVDILRDDPTVVLYLGILPTFSHLNILDVAHEFQSSHQDISLNLQIHMSSKLLDMLLSGQLDAIIANISQTQIAEYKRLFSIDVFSQDQICAVMHEHSSLAAKPRLSLSDFNDEPILLLSKGSSIRSQMEAAFQRANVIPTKVYECPEIYSMIGMLRAGIGIGFLSSRIAHQYIQAPIKSVGIDTLLETITVLMYSKENIKASALSLFSKFIQEMSQQYLMGRPE